MILWIIDFSLIFPEPIAMSQSDLFLWLKVSIFMLCCFHPGKRLLWGVCVLVLCRAVLASTQWKDFHKLLPDTWNWMNPIQIFVSRGWKSHLNMMPSQCFDSWWWCRATAAWCVLLRWLTTSKKRKCAQRLEAGIYLLTALWCLGVIIQFYN